MVAPLPVDNASSEHRFLSDLISGIASGNRFQLSFLVNSLHILFRFISAQIDGRE